MAARRCLGAHSPLVAEWALRLSVAHNSKKWGIEYADVTLGSMVIDYINAYITSCREASTILNASLNTE